MDSTELFTDINDILETLINQITQISNELRYKVRQPSESANLLSAETKLKLLRKLFIIYRMCVIIFRNPLERYYKLVKFPGEKAILFHTYQQIGIIGIKILSMQVC